MAKSFYDKQRKVLTTALTTQVDKAVQDYLDLHARGLGAVRMLKGDIDEAVREYRAADALMVAKGLLTSLSLDDKRELFSLLVIPGVDNDIVKGSAVLANTALEQMKQAVNDDLDAKSKARKR